VALRKAWRVPINVQASMNFETMTEPIMADQWQKGSQREADCSNYRVAVIRW
jgi:hypothetical protein